MSRRIDIELTSDRGDGTWTWRAFGAKQPKGVVRGDLLPDGASLGQPLRAEVEATLDGTEVVAVLPPKEKNRAEVQTLELIGRPVRDDELVTSKLAGKGGRDRGDRGERRGRDGDRRPRGDGDRGPRRDGERRGRDGDRRPRGDGDRGPRRDGEGRSERPRRERPAPPPKPKPKRLRAGRTHRKAAVASLSAAEQVIAEQLLMGGIPAVRQAVEKQNEQARLAGGREVAAEPLLAIAERLLPDLRAAEWRDRAEAAIADLDELDLRDLRSVVVAADGNAKGEESLALAEQLRTGLAARVDKEQAAWIDELTQTLAEGRVVRALRLSSRPPKAGAPLPAELATRLTEAASAALTADTLADRWATVLDALSFSPVRLNVAPASKPEEPSAELVATITRMADRVPKVAEAFGIDPSAAPARKRSRGGRGGAKGRPSGGAKPLPPKPPAAAPAASDDGPPAPDAPAADAPASEAPAPEASPAPEAPEAPEAPVSPEPSAPASSPAPEAEVAGDAPAPAAEVEDATPDASPEPATPTDGASADEA